MKNKHREHLIFGVTFIVGILACGMWYLCYLQRAHGSFENYYAFRGCTQLLEKTPTYGICKIASGDTIKIILIDGRWYLEGDGPGVW